jgi:hypothetical protein
MRVGCVPSALPSSLASGLRQLPCSQPCLAAGLRLTSVADPPALPSLKLNFRLSPVVASSAVPSGLVSDARRRPTLQPCFTEFRLRLTPAPFSSASPSCASPACAGDSPSSSAFERQRSAHACRRVLQPCLAASRRSCVGYRPSGSALRNSASNLQRRPILRRSFRPGPPTCIGHLVVRRCHPRTDLRTHRMS